MVIANQAQVFGKLVASSALGLANLALVTSKVLYVIDTIGGG